MLHPISRHIHNAVGRISKLYTPYVTNFTHENDIKFSEHGKSLRSSYVET